VDAAIAALPPAFRRKLMITCDGAGASHNLVKHPRMVHQRRHPLVKEQPPAPRAAAQADVADRGGAQQPGSRQRDRPHRPVQALPALGRPSHCQPTRVASNLLRAHAVRRA
jgi:hypothetical protein